MAFLLIQLAACGVPGEPIPRRPAIPELVRNLEARPAGERVELRFTLPARTDDGRLLDQSPAVDIFRWFLPAGAAVEAAPAPEAPVQSLSAAEVEALSAQGRLVLFDRIEGAERRRRAGEQAVYLVRTRLDGRVSVESNRAAIVVLPVPEPPAALVVEVSQDAIALRWSPPARTTDGGAIPAVAGYRIYRAEAPPPAQDAQPRQMELAAVTAVPAWRDTQFTFGQRYVYSVSAVAEFPAGTMESEPTEAVEVHPVDFFPPAAPEGLVAVYVPAAEGRPAAVELSWSANTEPDLAGYHVWRSEQEGTPGERRTREGLPLPVFRDTDILPGRRYFYSVTAADRAGNQSAPSAPLAVEIPAP